MEVSQEAASGVRLIAMMSPVRYPTDDMLSPRTTT